MAHHILVLDDEPLTRVSVSAALEARDGYTVVCQASTATQALEFSASNRVDVALLDIYLGPGPHGIDVAWELRRMKPTVGIVFLTSIKDPRVLGHDYRGAPSGSLYLEKAQISSVDGLYVTVDHARATAMSGSAKMRPPSKLPFTTHQLHILKLVSQGLSNAEIAAELRVSDKAIEATISRLSRGLGLTETTGGNRRVHIVRTYLASIGMTLP